MREREWISDEEATDMDRAEKERTIINDDGGGQKRVVANVSILKGSVLSIRNSMTV